MKINKFLALGITMAVISAIIGVASLPIGAQIEIEMIARM